MQQTLNTDSIALIFIYLNRILTHTVMWTEKFVDIEILESNSSVEIKYGLADSLFGSCLIGVINGDKICHLHFIQQNSITDGIEELRQRWPCATLTEDNAKVQKLAEAIFSPEKPQKPMLVVLQGTVFEINVWKSILKIPLGQTWSYADVAISIGNPQSVRAVAGAIAKNEIAYLIPCHRVISKSGSTGNYRWGMNRKSEILLYEKALAEQII